MNCVVNIKIALIVDDSTATTALFISHRLDNFAYTNNMLIIARYTNSLLECLYYFYQLKMGNNASSPLTKHCQEAQEQEPYQTKQFGAPQLKVKQHTNLGKLNNVDSMNPQAPESDRQSVSEMSESMISYRGFTNDETFQINENGDKYKQQKMGPEKGKHRIGGYVFQIDENHTYRIGTGTYGDVYVATSSIDKEQKIAVKVLRPKLKGQFQLCLQETLRQQLVKSQGIVKIISKQIQSTMFLIAMELMDQGHLKVPKDGYEPEIALQKIKLILKSYSELYKRGMAHRDLKPKNILINSKGELKISDFGSAKERTDRKQQKTQATPQYASPQQIKNADHTDKCDVYALGCIFFELIVGKPPKYAKPKVTLSLNRMDFDKLRKALQKKNTPQDIIEFIEGCLRQHQTVEIDEDGRRVQDPKQSRYSWEDVYLHPIFGGSFKNIVREVGGHNLLLTIKTFGIINKIDIIQILEQISQQVKTLNRQQVKQFFKKYNIMVPDKDIQRLEKMFGWKDNIEVITIMNQLKNVEQNQFSNYRPQDTILFLQMFKKIYKNPMAKICIKKLKNKEYRQFKNLFFNNFGLTSFPPLPEMLNLTEIVIKHSQIQVLDVKLNTPNLRYLNIKSNKIEKILTIRGCPNLQYLDISANRLTEMEGFQMIPNLFKLDVSINRLTSISNIAHLKHLSILNLSTNKISTIEGLQGCTELKTLFLNDNFIRNLNNLKSIIQLPLETIYLYGNRIREKWQNVEVIELFKKQHPKTSVYLSVKFSQLNEDFEQFFPTVKFHTGRYMIVSAMNKQACIGTPLNSNSFTMEINQQPSDDRNMWYFDHYKNDEFCLISNREQLVSWFYGMCALNGAPEQEQKNKRQEDTQSENGQLERQQRLTSTAREDKMKVMKEEQSYRWVFEKRGKDEQGETYFSISNVYWRQRIALVGKRIKTLSQMQSDRSDCWYIVQKPKK